MDFIKNFKLTPINVLKAFGLLIIGLFVLSLILSTFGVSRNSLFPMRGVVSTHGNMWMEEFGFGGGMDGYAQDASTEMEYVKSTSGMGIFPPHYGGSIGNTAEEYEVTEYNATIETRHKDDICAEILALKEADYIIFENANEHDRGCSYTLKVEHDYVSEVLSLIEELDPRNLSENTYTIQQQISNLASEEEILEGKLASIDDTLRSALRAYDGVTALATQTQDAEALAKIVDSKIGVIERLTRERINITAQLERIVRAKETQLDKLVYTYFYINVYENKFVDGENIKDSWKNAIKGFVQDINQTIQNVTIGLIAFMVGLVQYVLYFFILLIVIKYFWKTARYIWKK